MRYAVIDKKEVINVIESDTDVSQDYAEYTLVQSDEADIGDTYRNKQFIKPEVEISAQEQALSEIKAIEREITSRHFRDAILTDTGKEWLRAKELEIQVLREQL